MAEDSVYTKIIKGELPCHKVYEDDYTFAFLDIHPVQPGHTLVVTKRQAETYFDLSDEEYQALWAAVRKVATRLKDVYPEKKRIGIQVEGLDVAHVHVKIIPINTGSEFRTEPDMESEPNHNELAAVAEKLAF